MIAASAEHEVPGPPLRLGIAGLGMAGAMMIHAATRHPGVMLLDSPGSSPYLNAFLGEFRPEQVVPIGDNGSRIPANRDPADERVSG